MRHNNFFSDFVGRAAVVLGVMLTTTATAWAEDHVKSSIDVCKGGLSEVCITGWVYDTQRKSYETAENYGISVRAVVSTTPNENDDNYDESESESYDMEYVERPDVNSTFGLTGKHGFTTKVPVFAYWFEETSEMTVYVKIYATIGVGYYANPEEVLLTSTSTTVRNNIGYGTEEFPYVLSNAADWNLMADSELAPFYADSYIRLANAEDDGYDYDNSTAVTKAFGTSANPFTGHFDGKGQTLNVNISGTRQYVAPFAYVNGASIHDLTVSGSISGSQYAGGIVGHGGSSTLNLKNCACSATISGFTHYAGGILGWCDDLTLKLFNCLFKGSFSPGSGGKYHPIALKYASATVKAPAARGVYYLNTAAPSDGLDDNRVIGAEGTPVSETRVENEWDDTIRAVDGKDYYGIHFSGKSLPYEYNFPKDYLEDGWSIVNKLHDKTGLDKFYKTENWFVVLRSYETEGSQYLVSPEFSGRSGLMVHFDYAYLTMSDYAALQMGYSTTTPDIAAFDFDEVTTIDNGLNCWFQYERVFPEGTKYIAVKLPPSEDCYLELDNFRFTACDSPSPTHLTAVHITDNMASLTWEAPETDKAIMGYAYQYKKTSDTDWSNEVTVTTTSAELTNLLAETGYQFRVKALYSEDEASIYLPICFTTSLELPYEYGFENDMNGWKRNDKAWGYTGISDVAAHEGEYGYFFHSVGYSSPQYLISPQFPDDSPLVVSFYYKDCNPGSGMWETLYVGYSTTTNVPYAFTWGEALISTNIPWTRYENIFPEGTRFIAFKYTSSNAAGLYIDDISVAGYSVTPKPASLTVSNLTDTGATLSWTAPNEDVTGYAYQYRKTTDVDWSTETTVQATTVTLNGLTENTTYNFRVKALGSGGTASNYAITSFLTDGSMVDLPYADSFENGMGGWRLKSNDQATGIEDNKKRTGDHCFYFHNAGRSAELLYSPHFAGRTPMKVSFYYSCASSSFPGSLAVGYATSRSSIIFTKDEITVNSGDWTLYETIFPAEAQYIVIYMYETGYPIYLDDFSFTAASAMALVDNADNTSTIASHCGEEVAATLQGRTLYKGGAWNTLCLPFALSAQQVASQLAPTKLMTLDSSSFSGGTLTLNFTDATEIEAGKPYIIKWASGENLVNPVFTGIVSNATANVETQYVDFVGNTSPVTLTANDPSVLYLGNDTIQNPSSNMTLGSCRAYFHITDPTLNVQNYVLNFVEKGDMNGDGQLTVTDVPALVNLILNGSTDPVADVNGDGHVTLADVTALVNIVSGK